MKDKKPVNLCANGTAGYQDTGKGVEAYPVRDPCKNAPTPGHIFCTRCRVVAGGIGPVAIASERV